MDCVLKKHGISLRGEKMRCSTT